MKIKFCIFSFFLFKCIFVFGQAPEIEWQITIGGNDYEVSSSVYQTEDGGYIIGGYSASGISGNKTEAAWSGGILGLDYWIIKLDSNGIITWQNDIGGTDDDELLSIVQTTDKGYIAGGWSKSGNSCDKTEANFDPTNQTNDFWILKLDTAGNIDWQKTIGGNDHDLLTSLQQTTDGGYILGGYSNSDISGDKTEDHYGGDNGIINYYDYWIVKIDSSGNIAWQKTIGGNKHDHLNCIQQTPDGGYIIGGYSESEISYDKSEENFGEYDYWILKLDVSGNITWQKTLGGNSLDYLYTMEACSDGGYIFGGMSLSDISGNKTEASFGNTDYWLIKLDHFGEIEWQKVYGGSGADKLYSVNQLNDGGYILGGYSSSEISGNKTEGTIGTVDYWILKINSIGDIEWQNDIGGNNSDELRSIGLCNDGGYIVAGMSDSDISGDKTEGSIGIGDYWVIKLECFPQKSFADTDGDGYGNIDISTYECPPPFGYGADSTDCDDTNPSIHPGAPEILNGLDDNCDGFIDDGLEINNALLSAIKIYPNPATDQLFIETSLQGDFEIEIFDATGRIVFNSIFNSSSNISLINFSSGIYFMKIISEDSFAGINFVKE